jgi:cation transport regulator ChaC
MSNNRTDLEIANDLQLLCQTVNEAIDRANSILQKAQQIDEVRELIQKIDGASQDLQQNQQLLQQTKVDYESKLKQLEQAQSDIGYLKNLPQKLIQLGISENLLEETQPVLDSLLTSKQEAGELIRTVEALSQNLKKDEQLLQEIRTESESKFQQLARVQSDLEYLRNLSQELRQLGIHENFLAEVQRIIGEIEQRKSWFEQALNNFQDNERKAGELISKLEIASQDLKQNQRLLRQVKADCELKLRQLEQVQSDLDYLRNLPQTLRQLGIHENFISDMRSVLNEQEIIRQQIDADKQKIEEAINEQKIIQLKIEEAIKTIFSIIENVGNTGENVWKFLQGFVKNRRH